MIENYVGYVCGRVWTPPCKLGKGEELRRIASRYISFFDAHLVGEEDERDDRPISERTDETEQLLLSGDIQPLLDVVYFITFDCHGDDLSEDERRAKKEAEALAEAMTALFAPKDTTGMAPVGAMKPGETFTTEDGTKYRAIHTRVPVSGRAKFPDGKTVEVREIDVEALCLSDNQKLWFHFPAHAPERIFMVNRCN